MAGSLSMIRVVDSHTAGMPTRVIIEGAPDLGTGSVADRSQRFRRELDRFRSGIVSEPRGSDALTGALLCKPADPSSSAGVIFFGNAGYLDMCGQGLIGLIATLEYLGHIKPGRHRIETPLGTLNAELHPTGDISFENVASFRHRKNVEIEVEGLGKISGDVAFGGNWFFLVDKHSEDLFQDRVDPLTHVAIAIRRALSRAGITGGDGHEIDHIALFGPPRRRDAQSRNFILGPGRAYDRSPSATATSARLACLLEDGKLEAAQTWRQESIIGTVFDASINLVDGEARPTIRGTAYITADSMLIVDQRDPFCWGIR